MQRRWGRTKVKNTLGEWKALGFVPPVLQCLPFLFSSTSPLDVTQNCEGSDLGVGAGGVWLKRLQARPIISSCLAGVLFASFNEHIQKWYLESAKHRNFLLGFQLFLKFQQLLGL